MPLVSRKGILAIAAVIDVALNAPGTEHEVFSEEGCVVLLVWERQPIMLE